MGSLFERSQPNQKAMNFTKRDVKIEVDAKDSGQKTTIPSFSGANHKTAVDLQQPFASHLGTSDCAQMFFKQNDKDESRHPLANKNFHVWWLSWRIAFQVRNPLRFR